MIQERVISSMALVLEQFISKVKLEVPNAKFVYDEKLSYETAISKFRSDNNIGELSNETDALPLFAFKRSVLRHTEKGMGKRAATGLVDFKRNLPDGQSEIFKIVHGEMDIDFLFIVKSAEDSELFEIEYLSETGISKQKELLVDLREDLGTDLQYFVEYGPLSDKSMESESNYFKAITGSVKVVGFYPVFKSSAKQILNIHSKIYNSRYTDDTASNIIANFVVGPDLGPLDAVTEALADKLFWVDANAITGVLDGGALSLWPDRSVNERDLTQTIGNKKPIYRTAVQNGRAVVEMVGDNLVNMSFPADITGIKTVYMVAQWIGAYNNYTPLLGYDQAGFPPDFHGGVGSALIDTGYADQAVVNGAAWVNGVSTPIAALVKPLTPTLIVIQTDGGSAVCDQLTAQFGSDERTWRGWIGEIIATSNVDSTSVREGMQAGLMVKWGLA